ncbi:hypothetical protein [Caviibacter abscessus]|uniref:hypothetical protein n=1 Tax=Caviibacter abscessus TaxID=1766719 RepID=UPI00082BE3DC|nr:hypothetical protein [Caviibacter abscessus]
MLINLVEILFIILKLITGIIIMFQFKSSLKKVELMAIPLLLIDLILIIISIFTDKVKIFLPYFLFLYYKNWNVFIAYIIIDMILLIFYAGLNDNFRNFHRMLVSIYFISSIMGYIVLLL